jgi:hypothetical protein|tara:strand:- start:9365 stop:9535 length:171 start_codon:yes stop_codon:yes gene_type:complete
MTKEEVKEEKMKEVRKSLSCDKCGSSFVYCLADSTVVCRRCSHRNGKEILDNGSFN